LIQDILVTEEIESPPLGIVPLWKKTLWLERAKSKM